MDFTVIKHLGVGTDRYVPPLAVRTNTTAPPLRQIHSINALPLNACVPDLPQLHAADGR
jgi:hypothetical protein